MGPATVKKQQLANSPSKESRPFVIVAQPGKSPSTRAGKGRAKAQVSQSSLPRGCKVCGGKKMGSVQLTIGT
jgi:hypothetical protein